MFVTTFSIVSAQHNNFDITVSLQICLNKKRTYLSFLKVKCTSCNYIIIVQEKLLIIIIQIQNAKTLTTSEESAKY